MLRRTIKHNMRRILEILTTEQPAITEIYLFGSRAYGTMSIRSDCDIIVRAAPDAKIKSSDLRDFANQNCAPLDIFLCTEARAVSAVNDSFVHAADFETLIRKLDAQLLWTRTGGFADFAFKASNDWTFEVSSMVEFVASTLPDSTLDEASWHYKVKKVEELDLPVRPYIGDNLIAASAQLIDIARRMIMNPEDLGQKGQAKTGWTVNLKSEYDCQNLFYSVVKPWLPTLGREEVALIFDGQRKLSDFSLFGSRIIIEMKFIDSLPKKNEVVKTLDGLANFYKQHANIVGLLFLIYVKNGVAVDDRKWENNYSTHGKSPWVKTVIIRVP